MRAQLAEQSSTLLDNHPRIKELKAQIADLDGQIKQEAATIARSFENDAKLASARVDSQIASLNQLKTQAATTNVDDVQLRELERDAKSQRDLLENYLAKYREATARDTANSAPADARVISRATVSNVPAYPKKVPAVLIATLTTLVIAIGFVLTKELLAAPMGGVPVRQAPPPSEEVTSRVTAALNAIRHKSAPQQPASGSGQLARRRHRYLAARRRCRPLRRGVRRRAGDGFELDRAQDRPRAGRECARRAGRPRVGR